VTRRDRDEYLHAARDTMECATSNSGNITVYLAQGSTGKHRRHLILYIPSLAPMVVGVPFWDDSGDMG
jgi:hypothetical protein